VKKERKEARMIPMKRITDKLMKNLRSRRPLLQLQSNKDNQLRWFTVKYAVYPLSTAFMAQRRFKSNAKSGSV